MPLLLETIRINNGKVENLEYHQQRFDNSRRALFDNIAPLDLKSKIIAPPFGLIRCRILYDTDIRSIEYIPYTPKDLKTFTIVKSDIDYSYKFADRSILENLKSLYPQNDEIIIEKNGYLTDTTISNIAFWEHGEWITPSNPLLKGTMRTKLLKDGFLKEKPITKDQLSSFQGFALINAMIGFAPINDYNIKG
ncbi:MAG: aminotransferase class IV [Sulfurovaceae bacterium]|nr:aminotransferase class IV [Sulfurovaceae bacterium]